ncbi:hypothetical protein DLAC_04460 [Tieghemostelium lacteum]|uniref:Uncharacterized protein n=1 Tax=Tieghemostelium lacteum TaxID=361077 RepID=A0A151ZJW1_TIELA|nr:hypothetical protein DLAC_04460 [Tieghemostelium lacteum]|eukprot:KYQ94170.1 hypothetical protein DLAC_04460 [Tieghemostelium lacteum]
MKTNSIIICNIIFLILITPIYCKDDQPLLNRINSINNITIAAIVPTSTQPIVIGTHQSRDSMTTCVANNGGTLCYLSSASEEAKNQFIVHRVSSYGKCIAMLGISNGVCYISMYNTVSNSISFAPAKLDGMNLAVDERFIWVYTNETSENYPLGYIKAFLHSDCDKIEPTDKLFPAPMKKIENMWADPYSGKPRSLFLYSTDGNVFREYGYNESLTQLFETGVSMNSDDACLIRPFKDHKYLAAYPGGFRILDPKTQRSEEFFVEKEGINFCYYFANSGLDIYSVPYYGSRYLNRIIPGINFIISRPCFEKRNGVINITGSVERYSFQWEDNNSKSPNRTNLQPGKYFVNITLLGADVSFRHKVELFPPEDPTAINPGIACPGSSEGVLSFKSVKATDLNYTYVMFDGTQSLKNSTNGTFEHLKSHAYSFTITTIDKYGFKCVYHKNTTVESAPVPEVEPTFIPASCYNSTDGSIIIPDFRDQVFIYRLTPPEPHPPRKFQGIYNNLGGNTYVLHITTNTTLKNLQCTSVIPIKVPRPPRFVDPQCQVIHANCFGGNGSMSCNYTEGIDLQLVHESGRIFPSYVIANGTVKYKRLPHGSYKMWWAISNMQNSGMECARGYLNYTIDHPSKIQLDHKVMTTECTKNGIETLFAYAHGGVPFNGSDYLFSSPTSNSSGPYLNVSYWIDGVYHINISDSRGCVAVYNDFKIARPKECAMVLDQHGNVVRARAPGGLAPIGKKLGLILGLTLGVGVPIVCAAVVGAVFLIRKYGLPSLPQKPFKRKQHPNSIPVFIGGKIGYYDNF